jgi:hypothetical protein
MQKSTHTLQTASWIHGRTSPNCNSSGEGFETSFCQLSHGEKKLIERCPKSLSSFTSSCPHGMEVRLAPQRTTNPPLKSKNS